VNSLQCVSEDTDYRFISIFASSLHNRSFNAYPSFMSKQSYSNHTRYHPLYHFVLFPATITFTGLSIYFFFKKAVYENQWMEGIYFLLAGCIAALTVILVRSYSLRIQDRVIRTEVKSRYFASAGTHMNGLEKSLRTSQLMAIRFASDEELPRLAEQAVQEELSAAEIKKQIKKWKGDYYRI